MSSLKGGAVVESGRLHLWSMYEECNHFNRQAECSRYYGRNEENGPRLSGPPVKLKCEDHSHHGHNDKEEFEAVVGAGTTPFDVEVEYPSYTCNNSWDGNAEVGH